MIMVGMIMVGMIIVLGLCLDVIGFCDLFL